MLAGLAADVAASFCSGIDGAPVPFGRNARQLQAPTLPLPSPYLSSCDESGLEHGMHTSLEKRRPCLYAIGHDEGSSFMDPLPRNFPCSYIAHTLISDRSSLEGKGEDWATMQ